MDFIISKIKNLHISGPSTQPINPQQSAPSDDKTSQNLVGDVDVVPSPTSSSSIPTIEIKKSACEKIEVI